MILFANLVAYGQSEGLLRPSIDLWHVIALSSLELASLLSILQPCHSDDVDWPHNMLLTNLLLYIICKCNTHKPHEFANCSNATWDLTVSALELSYFVNAKDRSLKWSMKIVATLHLLSVSDPVSWAVNPAAEGSKASTDTHCPAFWFLWVYCCGVCSSKV